MFSHIQKLREFFTPRTALQKIMMEVIHMETKGQKKTPITMSKMTHKQ